MVGLFEFLKKCAFLLVGSGLVLVQSVIVDGYPAVLRNNDICGTNTNGRRIYLEFSEKGHLKASNVKAPPTYSSIVR